MSDEIYRQGSWASWFYHKFDEQLDYCCESFLTSVERREILYNPVSGAFWFYFKRNYEDSYGLYHLGYCPFCGAKLPENRMACKGVEKDLYTKTLKEALGKRSYDTIEEDEIPEEFKTDEWWKKRGL